MENKKIWLSLAQMTGREIEYVNEAFETNWIAPLGPNVNEFEKSLQEYIFDQDTVSGYAVALNTGTAALHLGLLQLGVKAGDEVICQSFTFAATANVITYLGAKPVFVDSETETWNMDPKLLDEVILSRRLITGKFPKAIISVNLYGMPAKLDELVAVSKKYGIPLLEDAAESLGSTYKGRKCGTFGTMGVVSFNGNKIITTSGGGALICKDKKTADKTLFYATQARDNAAHYQHSEIGFNYRMSNVSAGIGRGQLTGLDYFIEARRRNHDLYASLLKNTYGITVQENPNADFDSNFWLTCITIDSRKFGKSSEQIRLELEAENIESRPLWKPMHLQPVFSQVPYYGTGVSEKLFKTGLCLPSGVGLTEKDIHNIVKIILYKEVKFEEIILNLNHKVKKYEFQI
jgi:dTDP-4-amino-4,6-dideoxygalactose transaminase